MKKDWTYKKLGEVCEVFCDGDWIESKDQSEDGIRLIQTGNVGNGVYRDKADKSKYISEETFKQLNCTEIFPGDILVSRLPDPIGRACIIPDTGSRMITAVDCSIIRLKECINPNLFVYYTRSDRYSKNIDKYTTGTTRKRISRSNLALLSVPIPSLEEQQQIVAELDLLSGMIEKQKAQIEELNKLSQSIFYDMFGDPVTNEKGWNIIQLGEKCEVTSFKRVLIEEVVEKGVPFIRGTELTALSKMVKGEKFDFTLFITPEHYERVKAISGVPKIGDLLIPSINADGNIWVLDTEEPRYYKDGRVLWVHVNNEAYTSQALKFIMQIMLKDTYSDMASGATFAELKLFVLRELKVILPPLSLQQEFAAKIEAIEAMKAKARQSLKEAETLFNSRMDYYFN